MTAARRVLLLLAALALFAPGQARAAAPPVSAPLGLHGFLLRADEPLRESFPRTPSFAWAPVPGALRYEFELSTDEPFADIDLVWSGAVSKTPAISIPMSLPWMTGKPYALYARVRAVTKAGVSGWSQSFGFNMQPDGAPVKKKDEPGLLRWQTVDGATEYEVWFLDLPKVVRTITNSVDEREFYKLGAAPAPSVVRWRIRAVRSLYGGLPNGLPAVGYGAWSQPYTSLNPPFAIGPLGLRTSVSEDLDAASDIVPHAHTPAFLFSGSQTPLAPAPVGYRVYVATDRDCVNIVFSSPVIGSPAYSPRTRAGDSPTMLKIDGKPDSLMIDGTALPPNEQVGAAAPAATPPPPPASSTPPAAPPATSSASFALPAAEGALVDLWDSGWPNGRYYWTVIPVQGAKGGGYQDLELPHDACVAGRMASFGKKSEPIVASERSSRAYEEHSPFASGLSSDGKLIAASAETPTFYGSPVVSWEPAHGATGYELQWSRTLYPWKTADGSVFTFGTSALLQGTKALEPGTWWYRVRGLDPYLPGPVKEMSWSEPVRVEIAKPVFSVITPSNPSKKTKPETVKNGLKLVHEDGFSLGVPAKWRSVDRKSLPAELKRNPKLRQQINPDILDKLGKGDLVRLFAYDPGDLRNGLYVSVQPVAKHTHAQFLKDVSAAVAKNPKIRGKVTCVKVTLPAGKGLRCSYVIPVGSYLEEETAYIVDRPGSIFSVQYSCPPAQRKAKLALYERSVRTLKVLG